MDQSSQPDVRDGGDAPLRDRIRRCLHPVEAADPAGADASIRTHSDFDLNPDASPPASTPRPAAVLVPLVVRPEGLHVLLTRRTDHLADHAGQISFPGGRVEPLDRSPIETALRETEEEIGLDRRFVDVVGLLDRYETITGYHITPVVGFVSPGFRLTPDPNEVAEVFQVPFAFFLDPANHEVRHVHLRGRPRSFYVFPFQDYFIWGATAGMLMGFVRRLNRYPGGGKAPGAP